MEYEKLIQIINQNNISSSEVLEAVNILIRIDTKQLKKQDFSRIEEFIVDLNNISRTEEEDKALNKIINFIRDSSQHV